MTKVTLNNKRHTPNSIIGTHYSYDLMFGNKKMGELIHRVSKDTYNVNFFQELYLLNPEPLRDIVFPFNKEECEEKFSIIINELKEQLSVK